MTNFVNRRIEALLEKESLSYQVDAVPRNIASLREQNPVEEVLNTYDRLGGQLPKEISEIATVSYPILLENFVIIGDDELTFNRYYGTCLRSPLYTEVEGMKLDAYQRYCRQFEINCKKVGLQRGVWTNSVSEKHFGQAADPGDFYGNGSPGWKMNAFKGMIRDFLAIREGYQTVHFSMYDQIMSGGKLLSLGELMKSPSGEQYVTVEKYIKRRLGLPIATTE